MKDKYLMLSDMNESSENIMPLFKEQEQTYRERQFFHLSLNEYTLQNVKDKVTHYH